MMGLFTRTGRRPEWSMISSHFQSVRERRTLTPADLANADMTGAWLRDRLDSLGIVVTDEHHLYAVLAVAALNVEMADNALASGQLSEEQHDGICTLTLTITAGLIDYVPGDVR